MVDAEALRNARARRWVEAESRHTEGGRLPSPRNCHTSAALIPQQRKSLPHEDLMIPGDGQVYVPALSILSRPPRNAGLGKSI